MNQDNNSDNVNSNFISKEDYKKKYLNNKNISLLKRDNNSRTNIETKSYDYPSLKYVSQFNVSNTQLLPGRLRLLGCYN